MSRWGPGPLVTQFTLVLTRSTPPGVRRALDEGAATVTQTQSPQHDVDSRVLAEREAIMARIGGQTMVDALAATADRFEDSPAYADRHGVTEGWRTLSWRETHTLARQIGAALVQLGVQHGDTVAIMGSNRTEHLLADMGALQAAAVPMSIYSTLSVEQVAYVAGQSRPVVAILENDDHLARWSAALAEEYVQHLVLMDSGTTSSDPRAMSWEALVALGAEHLDEHTAELERRHAAATPQDAATILYTSGTTGNPKGVVLTHENVMFETVATLDAAGLHEPQRQISYLPLAHIAERVLALYGPQINGGHVHNIGDPAELLTTLGEVHPTAFFGVPRVWEKIKTGISAKLAADPDENNRTMVANSMAAGLAWVRAQQDGHEMTPEVEAAYAEADAGILAFLKLLLGLDQATWCASAAAPMPLDVAEFMAGLGLKVYDVYGMTETTGAFTVNGPGRFKLGTVGKAITGAEVRIAEDGEVLVRGPVNTPGYFENPTATAALYDADGWVHTGDIGTMDEDGFVSIVDRKKELIITSNGKNVAPSNIENFLKESPLVGHAMAIGDGRPYVVAVLTLDGEIAPLVAAQAGIEGDLATLASDPRILGMVGAAVEAANSRLSRPEQVKRWTLLATEWTAESAELTPTLKLKRRVVNENYADAIEAMYADDPDTP